MADDNIAAAKEELERLEELKRTGPRRRLDADGLSKYLPYGVMAIIIAFGMVYVMFQPSASAPVSNYTCAPSLACPSVNTSLSCPAVNVSCGQTDMVCSPSMVMYGSNQTVKINGTV